MYFDTYTIFTMAQTIHYGQHTDGTTYIPKSGDRIMADMYEMRPPIADDDVCSSHANPPLRASVRSSLLADMCEGEQDDIVDTHAWEKSRGTQ